MGVTALLGQQLVVRAALHYPPAVQHIDHVGELEMREAVGDEQPGATGEELSDRAEEARLGGRVECRGRFVQDDQVAAPVEATGQRESEQMGGFDILECDSLEQAIQVAAAHPVAQFGTWSL
ncbi:MAG TPA: YciI family protein [Kribbella sp.]